MVIYIKMDGSDYTVEDIISEEYLHVITDKKDEVLKLKNKSFWSIEITVLFSQKGFVLLLVTNIK